MKGCVRGVGYWSDSVCFVRVGALRVRAGVRAAGDERGWMRDGGVGVSAMRGRERLRVGWRKGGCVASGGVSTGEGGGWCGRVGWN